MTRKHLFPIIAVALLLSAACSTGQSAESNDSDSSARKKGSSEVEGAVKTREVDLPKSYKYSPSVIEVEPGDVVTWTNHDDFPHTVRLKDSGVDKPIKVGGTAKIAFDEAGTYRYDCSLHPTQMQGTVIVSEPSR